MSRTKLAEGAFLDSGVFENLYEKHVLGIGIKNEATMIIKVDGSKPTREELLDALMKSLSNLAYASPKLFPVNLDIPYENRNKNLIGIHFPTNEKFNLDFIITYSKNNNITIITHIHPKKSGGKRPRVKDGVIIFV